MMSLAIATSFFPTAHQQNLASSHFPCSLAQKDIRRIIDAICQSMIFGWLGSSNAAYRVKLQTSVTIVSALLDETHTRDATSTQSSARRDSFIHKSIPHLRMITYHVWILFIQSLLDNSCFHTLWISLAPNLPDEEAHAKDVVKRKSDVSLGTATLAYTDRHL